MDNLGAGFTIFGSTNTDQQAPGGGSPAYTGAEPPDEFGGATTFVSLSNMLMESAAVAGEMLGGTHYWIDANLDGSGSVENVVYLDTSQGNILTAVNANGGTAVFEVTEPKNSWSI